MFFCFERTSTMTAGQLFHDARFDEKNSVIGELKSAALVIELTRKLPGIPYFFGAVPDVPEPPRHGAPEYRDLPPFPGVSWFGG
jgi:hypothetical protein